MANQERGYDSASRAKRQKTSEMNPENNPYLAHMYDSTANGHRSNGTSAGTGLSNANRHKSSAALARTAEDGPLNAFNAKPLSQQYFNILKVRRNLPVHAQRYIVLYPSHKPPLTLLQGRIPPVISEISDSCLRRRNWFRKDYADPTVCTLR